jgi:hypothetical protein
MSPREIHDYLTRLCIEAGGDPVKARERMAQAAQVIVAELDEIAHVAGDGERSADEPRERSHLADAEDCYRWGF